MVYIIFFPNTQICLMKEKNKKMSLHKIPRTPKQELRHDLIIMIILFLGIVALIIETIYCLVIKGL